MNKSRRKELNDIQDRITALDVKTLHDEVREILSKLESVRDEEQDALDNLPDSLREGERGQDMEAGIDRMQEAFDLLETLADALDEFAPDEVVGHIDDAKGEG